MSNRPNRRKDNIQSASSSKAAELLQRSSALSSLFTGLEDFNISNFGGEVDLGIQIDDLQFHSAIAPEWRIIFKKLTKKDSLTREKAMKELDEHLTTSNAVDMKPAFVYYASNYPKLVMDSAPKIRSNANVLLSSFLSVLRKNASGPSLKLALPFLLLSLSDNYEDVHKSAQTVLDECFPGEKFYRLLEGFSKDAMNICLEIIKLKHKLVQPQQFMGDETDSQRQCRLIAQALETMGQLLDNNSEMCSPMCEDFLQSPTAISSLMGMQINVNVAMLSFLVKLLKYKPDMCFGTKIPTLVLNKLDAENLALSRNAFDCFLILAGDPRFYANCKVDKAVCPKLLSVVRKKGLHWCVLETSLLPSVALVHKNLPPTERSKWIFPLMDSFFDGDLQSISIQSWAIAFSEVCRYCFSTCSDDVEVVSFLFRKILQLVDTALQYSHDIEVFETVVSLINSSTVEKAEVEQLSEFRKALHLNLLNKLPSSAPFIEILIGAKNNYEFCVELLKSSKCTNEIMMQVLRKHPSLVEQLKEPDQGQCISERLCGQSFGEDNRTELLTIVCKFLTEKACNILLRDYIQLNDFLIGKIPIEYTKNVLSESERLGIAQNVLKILIEEEDIADKEKWCFASWISDQAQDDASANCLLDIIMEERVFTPTVIFFLAHFLAVGRIPKSAENKVSLKLLQHLLSSPCCLDRDGVLNLMSRLEVNVAEANTLLTEHLSSVGTTFSNVKTIPTFCFANATEDSFLPSSSQFIDLTGTLDGMFMDRMLIEDDAFLFSYFAHLDHRERRDTLSDDNEEFDFIYVLGKKAVFYSGLLKDLGSNDDPVRKSAASFIWICSVFVKLLQRQVSSLDKRRLLSEFSCDEFRPTTEHILSTLHAFSRSEYSENAVPVSVAFAFAKCLDAEKALLNDFLNDFHKLEASLFSSPLEASSFSLNFRMTEEIPSVMLELGADDNADDQQSTSTSCAEFDEATIRLWTYEFERALSTRNSLEMTLVTLKIFVEKRSCVDEWLFMFQGERIKDCLSCVVLKVCCKVVPYLSEIESSIRDFVNCGFITAFQSCTDAFSRLGECASSLVYTMSLLCLKLHCAYENCVKLNMDNESYSDIKQEWKEFFGPSSANFIVGWFLDLAKDSTHSLFLSNLCRSLMSIDDHRLLKVELPAFSEQPDASDFFEGYPTNLKAMMERARHLFFSSKTEIQLASAKLFKSALPSMFLIENGNSCGSVDDETGTDEYQILPPQECKKLPQFFSTILRKEVDNDQASIDTLILAWDVIVRFLAELDVLYRVAYCDSLNHKLVRNVMNVIFSLLPDPPTASKNSQCDSIFTESLNYQHLAAFNLDQFVCHLYYKSLVVVPALVRGWYKSLSKNAAANVNRYTKKYVSHLVLRREIQNVANTKRGRLEVKVMPKVNEVAAFYRMEDSTIRLNISLPADYPLALATIETERSIVSKDLHRKWLLQLEMFLGHQNGSMLEGILQWKRNIDKHLEGIEDCTICMMTVSSTNYQLPKIRCRQCKNKFHGDCLYKWFQTSSNSSCPLCRSNFV